jgi:hypothetical protein
MSPSRPPAAVALVMALVLTAPVSVSGARPSGRTASRGPLVRSMIVGAGGTILSSARTVRAGATAVRVGRRRCALAAGTPLAVLAAARRAGGPPFAVRDYGRCGASPANSGELFVYSLGGESNRAQNGWEYKVDGVAGSAGAGDPSGPNGDGRLLRAGERVLWFWCRAVGGGCERTLEVASSATTVQRGGSLAVAVAGYDNEGRSTPIAGAIVTLGSDFASTGPDGRATLIAPAAPGRYAVSAHGHGLVPSFPTTIAVR